MWHTWNLTCTHMHSDTHQPLLHVLDTLHFYKAWKIFKLKKVENSCGKTLWLTHSWHAHTHKHTHTDTLKGRRSRKHNQNARCPSNEKDNGIKLKFLSPRVFLSIVRSFPLQGGVMGRFIYICGSVLWDHLKADHQDWEESHPFSHVLSISDGVRVCPSVRPCASSEYLRQCDVAEQPLLRAAPGAVLDAGHLTVLFRRLIQTLITVHMYQAQLLQEERETDMHCGWDFRAKTLVIFRMEVLLYNTYWSHYAICYVPQMASNYPHPAVVTKCHICWITYMYFISQEKVNKLNKFAISK